MKLLDLFSLLKLVGGPTRSELTAVVCEMYVLKATGWRRVDAEGKGDGRQRPCRAAETEASSKPSGQIGATGETMIPDEKAHHTGPDGVVAVFVEDEAAPEDGGAGWGGWGAREEPQSGASGLRGGLGGFNGLFAESSLSIPVNVKVCELGRSRECLGEHKHPHIRNPVLAQV